MPSVFRFAPSPNGALHLGHALSALINCEAARAMNGRFLLRIEDIDQVRCTRDKTTQMLDDLRWLGLQWEEPVMQQSDRFGIYQASLDSLRKKGLIYPSTASRKEVATAITRWESRTGRSWPRDPDGANHFPRDLLKDKKHEGSDAAWRLDMAKALALCPGPYFWRESGPNAPGTPNHGSIPASPEIWGDVVLARKDCPTSYHLSVVIDDAAQGVSHVVRGLDLFHATGLHRLLQALLGLPEPCIIIITGCSPILAVKNSPSHAET